MYRRAEHNSKDGSKKSDVVWCSIVENVPPHGVSELFVCTVFLTALNSESRNIRILEGCTNTRTPFLVNLETAVGVKGERRSH